MDSGLDDGDVNRNKVIREGSVRVKWGIYKNRGLEGWGIWFIEG